MLNLIGKYLGVDLDYISKGGFWLTLGQIVSGLCSLALVLVFANFLPKEVYGTYKYILSIVGLLSLTTLPSMNIAIVQAVASGHKNYFFPALKTEIKYGLVGGIVGLGFSVYYFSHNNTILGLSFLVVSVFVPLMDSLNLYDAVLQGMKRFDVSSQYLIYSQITVTSLVVLVAFFTKSLFLLVFVYLFAWTALRLFWTTRVVKQNNTGDVQDNTFVNRGKHLSLVDAINGVVSQIDKIIVFHFLGAEQLATYVIAIAMPNQITAVTKNIGTLAMPKIAENDIKEIRKTVLWKMFLYGITTTIIVAGYILASPFLFKFLLPKYIGSLLFSQLFAVSMIGTMSILPVSILQMKGRTSLLYKTNSIDSVIEISTMVILTLLFGLIGMIIARIINRFIYLGITTFMIWKI